MQPGSSPRLSLSPPGLHLRFAGSIRWRTCMEGQATNALNVFFPAAKEKPNITFFHIKHIYYYARPLRRQPFTGTGKQTHTRSFQLNSHIQEAHFHSGNSHFVHGVSHLPDWQAQTIAHSGRNDICKVCTHLFCLLKSPNPKSDQGHVARGNGS